jgi:hypothetical protein
VEFIIGKVGRDSQVWSLPGGMEEPCIRKTDMFLFLRCFYKILNLDVGKNLCLLCIHWLPSWGRVLEDSHVHLRFYCFITRMCIQGLGHFSPSPTPSLTTHSTPLSPRPNTQQKLFCPYFSFCCRESISNNRKEQGFLLVEIRIAIQGIDSH